MSTEDVQPIVWPEDVESERNLLRNIQRALGMSKDDPTWDDNAMAALIANTARLNHAVMGMSGDIEPNIQLSPNVDVGDIDVSGIDFEDLEPINRVQVYDVATTGSTDNLLTQSLRPMAESSTFRITVSPQSEVVFSLRSLPDNDNDPGTTQDFNGGGTVPAGARFEFSTDVDPGAEYNFRTGSAVTVSELRVQEYFTT